jgi:hypothetical protein
MDGLGIRGAFPELYKEKCGMYAGGRFAIHHNPNEIIYDKKKSRIH